MTPSQLQRLTTEWDLECELLEGDLVVRQGKTVKLFSKLPVCSAIGPHPATQGEWPGKLQRITRSDTTYDVDACHLGNDLT
jgi:hypothetical protein